MNGHTHSFELIHILHEVRTHSSNVDKTYSSHMLNIHSVPGPEPGTEFTFELPAKFGVGRSKLGDPGHIYPKIKGQWSNWIFF